MATYEEIYGKRVKDFDSDPTLESSYEGQVWYDKSSGVLKSVVNLKHSAFFYTLSTSGYSKCMVVLESNTANLVRKYQSNPPSNGATEEYNGSSWATQGNDYQLQDITGGAGTQTAALILVELDHQVR